MSYAMPTLEEAVEITRRLSMMTDPRLGDEPGDDAIETLRTLILMAKAAYGEPQHFGLCVECGAAPCITDEEAFEQAELCGECAGITDDGDGDEDAYNGPDEQAHSMDEARSLKR